MDEKKGSIKIKPAIGITVSLIAAIVFFLLGFSISQQMSGLRVRDYYYFRDGAGYDGIWGVIENRSDELFSNVSIKFVILGQMDIPVGTQDIYIGNMLPHTRYKFDQPVSEKYWTDYLNECKLLWIKSRP